MFLQSWLLFPVVLVVLSLGAGLLVERIARPAVPGALVLPLGLALVIVVSALFTYLDATAELAAPAVAVLGVAGLVAGLPRLKAAARASRGLAWPAVAGLLPAAAVAAPVVLTGDAGFTGYARIVDLAFQVDFAAYLQDAGRQMPAVVDSSYLSVVQKMIAVRYPGGAQSALGAVASLTGLDPLWAWQPFIALLAACLGLSLFSVLRVAIPLAPLRAVAAGIAAQATALYAYALVAGIKELAAAAFLVLVAALLAAHRPGDGAWRQVVPAAVAIAAAFSVINVGILPWLGIYAGLFFVLDLTRRRALRARVLANWVLLGVLAGVLALPALAGSLTIATVAAAGGPGGLGNLAAPVPVWSTAGVWLTSDYRFPLAVSGYEKATYALIAITLAFAALGLLRAIATRDWPLIGLGAAGAIAVAYIVWKAEPWSEFKAFTISAPLMLTLAFAGAAALWRAAPRPGRAGDRPRPGRAVARASAVAALLAGGVIGLGVLAGNAMTYHGTSLAPTGSLAELQRIGDRYAGQGPTLYPVFDEYGEYLLRDARANSIVNPLGGETGLRPTAVPGVQFVREPDEYELAFLNRHRLLVLRRDPTASRPPSNWRRIDRTRHYEVWRRTADPVVVAHMPLRAQAGERSGRFCRQVATALRDAGPGARVAYRPAPEVVQYVAAPGTAPGNWQSRGGDYNAQGPGRLDVSLVLPSTTRYSVWLRGSFGRAVTVTVDGRALPAIRWQESYPGQYVALATLDLEAGPHRVTVSRTGGALLPGTGNDVGSANALGTIGPLAFAPVDEPRIRTAGAAEAMDVCRGDRRLDWIEIVRPAGR